MKIHTECEQGSMEWHKLRAGIPTASEFKNLLTPTLRPRPWSDKMPKSYLAQKLAEAWTGGPLDIAPPSRDAEFGKILEDEARGWISLETRLEVQQVAFITIDDGRIGCSPDGMVRNCVDVDLWLGGVEIKCPEAKSHCKYLLAGEVPDDYLPQVHGSLYVTGLPWWKFVSYRRGFPGLILHVERDEKIAATIDEVLAEFLERFDAGMKLLEEKNGGPAPKDLFQPPRGFGAQHIESDEEHAQHVFSDPDDIIP